MIQQSYFWVFSQKIEIRALKRYLYTHVHCSTVRSSSQDVETT